MTLKEKITDTLEHYKGLPNGDYIDLETALEEIFEAIQEDYELNKTAQIPNPRRKVEEES